MNVGHRPFPDHQPISTPCGVTFTPWYDPDHGAGFRTDRDGLTVLVYLSVPADPGGGRNLSVDVCTRIGDADDGDLDAAVKAVRLDLSGPVTTRLWTDGSSVGWHVEGLHRSRYVYLTPFLDGDADADVTLVRVCSSDSDDPHDAGTALRLPVHDRTAERVINAGPTTGPGVVFDPAAFVGWFRTAQRALPGLVTAPYDSTDPDDSAALRAQLLLFEGLPDAVWRLGTAVSEVQVWPTTDAEGAPAGDGRAVITVRYGPVELCAGHLAADELIHRVSTDGTGTVEATALHAAIQALTAIAERVNTTIRHAAHAIRHTAAGTRVSAAARPGVAGAVTDALRTAARPDGCGDTAAGRPS